MKKGKRFNNKKTSEGEKIKEKKKDGKKFNINYFFILLFSILFIFSCIQIIMWYINTKNDKNEYEKLFNQVVITDNIGNVESEELQQQEISIDFEQLLNINKDVVGWIMIDETNINYPILKSSDNDYYLKRDINKNITKSGSIFLDYTNNGFADKNTVIYGHNMKNGTMFSQLKRIYNNELGTDVKIKIYTPDENKIYKVFSTYTIKAEDFSSKAGISEIQEKSKIDFNVDVKESDKILTLFTCTDTMLERIIVHAVLEN